MENATTLKMWRDEMNNYHTHAKYCKVEKLIKENNLDVVTKNVLK